MPAQPGFTGTVPELIDWLRDVLAYGGVRVDDKISEDWLGWPIRRVETVTGGYSDDEELLGRLQRSFFGICFWESTHRGGLTVYEVDVDKFDDKKPVRWLEPEDDI